jgi:hypothetical protein
VQQLAPAQCIDVQRERRGRAFHDRRDVAGRADEEGEIESPGKRQRQPRQRGGDAVERNGGRPFVGVGANRRSQALGRSPNFARCVAVLPAKCCST